MTKSRIALVFAVLGLWLMGSSWVYAESGTPIRTTIWDYQKELGLNDTQVAEMRKTLTDGNQQTESLKKLLDGANAEAIKSVREQASIEQIKVKLEKVAALQVQMQLVGIVTLRKFNGLMTQEQLAKWRGIQKRSSDT